jgi:hypothetical protein
VTGPAWCAAALLLGAPPLVDAAGLGLPAPFDRVEEADVARLAQLDGGTKPSVRHAAVSKAEAEPHLVAALETAGGGRGVVELALRDGALAIVAQGIENGGWDDVLELDLAPYRLAKDQRAIGVRYQRMVRDGTGVFLVLYLRRGGSFDRVFEEQVRYVPLDGDGAWDATVQVVPRAEGWSDLRVAVPGRPRQALVLGWDAPARKYVYRK